MHKILIKELMVTKVITAHIQDSLSAVEEKFRLHGIRHMPVVNEKNEVIGVFTQRDLMRCVVPRKTDEGYFYDKEQMDHFILKYVMHQNPLTLTPENSILEATEIMSREKFGCIPIVNADKVLVGILTRVDLLKFLFNYFKERM